MCLCCIVRESVEMCLRVVNWNLFVFDSCELGLCLWLVFVVCVRGLCVRVRVRPHSNGWPTFRARN